MYIFVCRIHQNGIYHITYCLYYFRFVSIPLKGLNKESECHSLGLKRPDLLAICLNFQLFISRCHLIICIYFCRMTVSVVNRAEWIFQPSFFPLLRYELWDMKSELCVVTIQSNLHLLFLKQGMFAYPPSFPANRQEMQPGRSAIKQTLALKGVRGFVPARFAC